MYRNDFESCDRALHVIVLLIVGLIAATLLGGCAPTKYVPVERVVRDTLRETQVQRDSVYVREREVVESKGDTVYVTRWRDRYRDRLLTDTVYVSYTDSVQVIVEVERKLTKWQQRWMTVGKVSAGICAALLLITIGKKFL